MSADQIVGLGVSALALGVLVGYSAHGWLDAHRTARRHAAAEAAFWQALMRVVDGAETPARAVGEIRSVRAMREQIADNECRRLREDIEKWESA